jgi:hypothetical protein
MSNTDVVWIGENAIATLMEDVPCDIDFDKFGIASATLNYSCLWDNAAELVSNMFVHPDFNWLVRKSAKISRQEANLAKVSISYEGIPPLSATAVEAHTIRTVKGSTTSEPIESHQNFHAFAGFVDGEWLNGAAFETEPGPNRGKFLGFFPAGSAPKKKLNRKKKQVGVDGSPKPAKAGKVSKAKAKKYLKYGIKSYYGGSIVFTETKIYDRTTSPSPNVRAGMGMLGKIDVPPQVDNYVSVEKGRDWLLMSCDVDQIGNGIKVSRSWKLSGPNGWDGDIYTYGYQAKNRDADGNWTNKNGDKVDDNGVVIIPAPTPVPHP